MKRVSRTRHKPLTGIGRLRIGLSLAWLFVLLLLLFTGSCTQTDVEGDVIPPHALKDVDAGFNLNVLANRTPVTRSITFTSDGTIESDTLAVGVGDSVRTKAAAPLSEAEESQIASLWVGQYDAATGQLLFSRYLSSLTGSTVNLKLKQSQTGGKSRVYFVSNAGDLGAIADETTLKKHTLAYASTDAGLPDNNLCKMMGIWEGEVVAGGVKDITVELTRLLAKITFTYSMGADFAFTPTSVVLKNAPSLSQVDAPEAQLTTGGISYKTYSGTASSSGATVYWYLPENMAGTVSGANAVDSEKKKIGTGITNATCIELTGNAMQGGVTYKDVTFRFYPGSDKNNYDILRNAHYTMAVTLVGIDVSDERISVGEIPPIVVDPEEMPAKKGGEKEIQITARPGQQWVFDMPGWLSALLDGKEIPSGATITYQGPATVVFKAVEANPKAEKRSVSFNIDVNGVDQEITITQTGSTLIKGSDVSLTAAKDSEGESTFTATEGLQWSAALDGDGWLGWSAMNPETSGDEAPENAQTLKVKATASNPSASQRSGKITVKAGASVGDAAYTGLKKEIAVVQEGSKVKGAAVNVSAEAASGQSSFTATAGLEWELSVAGDSWITLTGSTSGSSTTGSAQVVTFDVPVNPSSLEHKNDITVRAGDVLNGPTDKISVTQLASSLTATVNPTAALAATANASGTYTMNGTKGLSYSFTSGFPAWLTVTDGTAFIGGGTTTGSNQQLTYKTASINPNALERKATVIVKAGSMTKNVEIKQAGSTFTVDKTEIELENTATSGSVKVTGTDGLPWTVSPSVQTSGITPATTSSTATGSAQTLTFNAAANTGGAREATFTVAVTGGDHSKTVKVKQKAGLTGITLTVDQSVLTSYRTKTTDMTVYPPFNYDGSNRLPNGSSFNGSTTMTGSYTIQVEKGQRAGTANYATMQSYCSSLNEDGLSGWRIPTQIELHAMYINKAKIEGSTGAGAFISYYYWSSSVFNGNSINRCILNFTNGSFDYTNASSGRYVRCVRDN